MSNYNAIISMSYIIETTSQTHHNRKKEKHAHNTLKNMESYVFT